MPKPVLISIIVLGLIVVAAVVWVVLFPTQAGNEQKFERTFTESEQSLIADNLITKDELAAANGKEGAPAWIALDDVVYNVGSQEQWQGGEHQGNLAGRDLTDAFLQSGHGRGIVQDLEVVGGYSP